jgi:hypothetical protein
MKHFVYLPLLVLAFAGGFLLGQHTAVKAPEDRRIPPAGDSKKSGDAPATLSHKLRKPGEKSAGQRFLDRHGDAPSVMTGRNTIPIVRPHEISQNADAQYVPTMEELSIENELASVLAELGLEESDIQETIENQRTQVNAPESDTTGATGDVSTEQISRELEAVLIELGIPSEDIADMVSHFMREPPPPPVPLPHEETDAQQ